MAGINEIKEVLKSDPKTKKKADSIDKASTEAITKIISKANGQQREDIATIMHALKTEILDVVKGLKLTDD